jgi:hypothetical protein
MVFTVVITTGVKLVATELVTVLSTIPPVASVLVVLVDESLSTVCCVLALAAFVC